MEQRNPWFYFFLGLLSESLSVLPTLLGQDAGGLWPMAHRAWPPRGSAEPRTLGSDFHMTRGPQTPAGRPPAFLSGSVFMDFLEKRDCCRNLSGWPFVG